MGVVHHRHDRRGLGRCGDQGDSFRIVGQVDIAAGVAQGQPLRRDHVQRIDVLAQGLARFLVPADVETDRQGFERLVAGRRPRPADSPGPVRLGALQESLGRLLVQALQYAGVLQLQDGQAGGEGQGGEEAGDDGRQQRQHQPAELPGAARPAA